jgi:hypothetical protein
VFDRQAQIVNIPRLNRAFECAAVCDVDDLDDPIKLRIDKIKFIRRTDYSVYRQWKNEKDFIVGPCFADPMSGDSYDSGAH